MMVYTTVMKLFLLLVAFSAQFLICVTSYSNETDRLSLLDFRKAISLDPQEALMSWNESTHFCNWEGVMCSMRIPPRVISLNLMNRGLVGPISPSLGNLTFLKHLVLSQNAFNGYIPPSLGNHLHRLEYLHLDNNKLGGIIPDFANLSNLMLLHLGQNHLTGQIPVYLPPRLHNLSLMYNNLTGTIPSSISNITMLKFLDCNYNIIEGTIPTEFGKLSRMQSLEMGVNKLSGSFPNAILNLSSLTSLTLAVNELSGELPSNLGSSIPNLQKLVLAENFFGGRIPHSLFMNASHINHLDMARNNLTGLVPSSIGKLTKLLLVNLEYNQLKASNKKDWEFMYSLANCTELNYFSMAGNSLVGHVPDSLGNLSVQLQTLYLGLNKLSGGFPFGISNFPNLIEITLHDNQFTGVVPEWMGSLKSLQVINIQDNNFSGFIPSSLSNLSQLGYLFLDNNQFDGHLHASFGNLRMLDTLSISSNLISGIIPKEIFGIPTLRQLVLNLNNLEGELPTEVGNAKQLVKFVISSNKLSGEIPNTFGSIPVSLGNISNLHVLNLSRNNLTGSIPLSLGNLPLLEYLDLSFNHLRGEVPTHGIFCNVTYLRIHGNPSLCGGAKDLHLQTCSTMHLKPILQKKSIVKKVVMPLGVMMSVAIVVSVMLTWIGKQRSKSVTQPSFDQKYPKVSYNDIARATDDFSSSRLINKGRFSAVYQGKLFQGRIMVAIKVFSLETKGAPKSFIAECSALRNMRHRNLVPILTACSSIDSDGNDFKALVYEFMPGERNNIPIQPCSYKCLMSINLMRKQHSNEYHAHTHLIEVTLHDNQFTGVVPEWLGSLKSLQVINIQDNNFSGFIPSSLSNLSQLGYLFLDNN
ncbi:hypothetical protein EJB05_57471, partial [Eragrostis curvula]